MKTYLVAFTIFSSFISVPLCAQDFEDGEYLFHTAELSLSLQICESGQSICSIVITDEYGDNYFGEGSWLIGGFRHDTANVESFYYVEMIEGSNFILNRKSDSIVVLTEHIESDEVGQKFIYHLNPAAWDNIGNYIPPYLLKHNWYEDDYCSCYMNDNGETLFLSKDDGFLIGLFEHYELSNGRKLTKHLYLHSDAGMHGAKLPVQSYMDTIDGVVIHEEFINVEDAQRFYFRDMTFMLVDCGE